MEENYENAWKDQASAVEGGGGGWGDGIDGFNWFQPAVSARISLLAASHHNHYPDDPNTCHAASPASFYLVFLHLLHMCNHFG
jgi:hypothetical protein